MLRYISAVMVQYYNNISDTRYAQFQFIAYYYAQVFVLNIK